MLASIVAKGQQVEVDEEGDRDVEIHGIPEEPQIQGGILSPLAETSIEHRPSFEKVDSLSEDDSLVDGSGTPSLL